MFVPLRKGFRNDFQQGIMNRIGEVHQLHLQLTVPTSPVTDPSTMESDREMLQETPKTMSPRFGCGGIFRCDFELDWWHIFAFAS